MPCRSDYMEPGGREKESKAVAQHLVYLCTELKLFIPAEVQAASTNYYGNPDKCDEFTELLCTTIRSQYREEAEDVIYNGREQKSRALADWWECHQKWDDERNATEALDLERQEVVDSLTDRQRQILNLD